MNSIPFVFCIILFVVKGNNVTEKPHTREGQLPQRGENVENYYAPRNELPQECGKTIFDKDPTLKAGNEFAKLGQFPWMVRLCNANHATGSIWWFDCGGALINKYFVIAAAYCDQDSNMVIIGETHTSEQLIQIRRKMTKNFCREPKIDDLLVVELKEPAKFNDYVQPICFPPASWSTESFVKQHFTVAGWGVSAPYTNRNLLKFRKVSLISRKACKKEYSGITERHLCMNFPEDEPDHCKGHFGGATFRAVDGPAYIFGVTAYMKSACKHGVVYTSVLHFRKDILNFMERN